jgi:hypothetical protein
MPAAMMEMLSRARLVQTRPSRPHQVVFRRMSFARRVWEGAL